VILNWVAKERRMSLLSLATQIQRTTPNPNFKVMPLFDAEYVRNDTRYIVSMEY